jgi:subtilisin family serine protease
MKQNTFRLFFLVTLSLTSLALYSQREGVSTVDSLNKKYLNWYNLSPVNDKEQGAAVYQAYNEILKTKSPSKKIIVAVIDGGVDVKHPELQGKLWFNKLEIAGNGIDDDKNGYIDDIHGWNFIGNSKGENIQYENMEYVRIYKTLNPKFGKIQSIDEINSSDRASYELYISCKTKYDEELKKYENRKRNLDDFEKKLTTNENILKEYLKKDSLVQADVEAIQSDSSDVTAAKQYLLDLYKKGYTSSYLSVRRERVNVYLDYYLNLDFDPRKLIADNLEDINDNKYGNNDVTGPSSFHGTFVSGIIAANRNNGIGIDGIAENVEIMAVRVVPDGDERDKDVALGIRYAVDNGANIINMSFGKYFATNKKFVDDAIKYAEEHNVLMVHAAGNEAENLDKLVHYPTKILDNGSTAQNWLTVGASTDILNEDICAVFSNYGKESVDLFAPGVNIISLFPGNSYDMGGGTSYASPVVAGVAALVWSYYPELTATELKSIILKSGLKHSREKVNVPNMTSKEKTKERFSKLSVTGSIVNSYDALLAAQKYVGKKHKNK